jgi:hypothetical protein
MVLRHWVAWKALERPGMPWKGPRHRTYRGLRPINTAYLPTVDSVVENIVVVYRQSITTERFRGGMSHDKASTSFPHLYLEPHLAETSSLQTYQYH